MRFIMVTHGSEGDYFPFTTLGRQFKQQGHEVILLGQEDAVRIAQKHGLDFHSICPVSHALAVQRRLPEMLAGTAANQLNILWEIMVEDVTRRIQNKIEELLVPGQTVVFALSRLIGARIARDRFHFPLISVNLTPTCFDNFMDCQEQEADRVIGHRLNQLRAEWNLAPLDQSIMRWCYSPDLTLALFPAWFAPGLAHWPKNTLHTTFPLPPLSDQPLDEELTALVQAPAKPMVFIGGTFNMHPQAFLDTMYALCDRLHRPGILLGWRGPVPENPPANITIRPFVPLSALLPHVALYIHHAGVGSIAEGIRAGVPQIALPNILQQKGLARRLEALGLGYNLEDQVPSVELVQPLAEQALKSQQLKSRCSEFSTRFKGLNSGQAIADQALEAVKGLL